MGDRELHNPITGGCLCGEIRYTVDFPTGSRWPPEVRDNVQDYAMDGAFTCQCTPCRKNTGSLVAHFLGVPAAQITWASPPESGSSYREYASSAGCFRGFCETCGTTLTWRSERDPGTIELLLGTVDAGEGLVKELCVPAAGQFWCSNFVAGVTDGLVGGERWVENRGEGGVRLGESR